MICDDCKCLCGLCLQLRIPQPMSKGVRIYYEKKQDYTHHGEELYSMNITFDTALLRNTAEKKRKQKCMFGADSRSFCLQESKIMHASGNSFTISPFQFLLRMKCFNIFPNQSMNTCLSKSFKEKIKEIFI